MSTQMTPVYRSVSCMAGLPYVAQVSGHARRQWHECPKYSVRGPLTENWTLRTFERSFVCVFA